MENELNKIREQQKEAWNTFSSGWKKWDDLTMEWLKPMGDEIISYIRPKNGDIILDVASGTGEPGLTIASMIGDGKLYLTDLSEDMLTIASENALNRGIRNTETIVCDVCELPFEDNTFDAISCRFGFMFFPDMLLAAKEMVRVLKPGGRIATSVWGIPEKNFWVTATMGTINRNLNLSPPPPGSPGIFRCAKDGLMHELFSEAGLKNISEKEVTSKLNSKTSDVYWNMMNEIAAPVVGALSKADDAMKRKIKEEVYQALNEKYPDGNIMIDSSATVIYGEK
ncbi:class I SAM-dependent methyltransferase [Flavobacterium capsici]|uniref:Class I SAM-dependent methyltransferase n=1 Tax=Flavobacterium capsici TaxID=3075618 RepID=A0AA96EVL9_9FLAO|nr:MULTISPECIES: class I SAM-dependent methyltransferase [unclassified Flavobacterium]WNM18697.1 class I SAM-dependent methyltransferase [Flavobacterium sp. PMR2A8]WNM22748.1 class I SAM-dependent methyltransferase [Flavobacterium sp. PMTSA4]